MSLPTRKIGDTEVSSIGYGAMGISAYYGTTEPDEERFKVTSSPILLFMSVDCVSISTID